MAFCPPISKVRGRNQNMHQKGLGFIILAAGKGTRMRSDLPKVFHHLADLPLVEHVMNKASSIGAEQVCMVVGPEFKQEQAPTVRHTRVTQVDRLGTGHAAKVGLAGLEDHISRVVVLFGDVPLISSDTMDKLANSDAAVSLLAFEPQNPASYGRVVLSKGGQPLDIVEFKDANDEQKKIGVCNGGPMSFDAAFLRSAIHDLSDDNAQAEFYMTDLLAIAANKGLKTEIAAVNETEITGVNTRMDLAYATAQFQKQQRLKFMTDGVTLQDPDSVFFSHNTQIGQDVVIESNVVFGPNVRIESGARIRAFSHIEGTHIHANAIIGPYARLRPGTEIGEGAKIGNFVETKNSVFAKGAKANHLSYVGDTTVGEKANIGAGSITCNYDGYNKSKTVIGAGAFIGSNSALVAPVEIGDGAIIAAGTTVAKPVEANAIAITRAEQKNISGAAERFRTQKLRQKNKNKN